MNGRPWTPEEDELLRRLYPDQPTARVAAELGRKIGPVYQRAYLLGLRKSDAYLAGPDACRLRKGDGVGKRFQFQKGHVPANKGLRRPGWHRGRMRETQFQKGGFPVNRDPDYYVIGALRVNADGYIDMRVSFERGAAGWRALHRILWEDAHGPIPEGHVVTFIDGDRLNVELANLQLTSRADLARRNSIHNLPPEIKGAITALGALKRAITIRGRREEQDRGPPQPPVRDARGPA